MPTELMAMTGLEFWHYASARMRSRKDQLKLQRDFALEAAACTTAEIVNVMGSWADGSKWESIQPYEYFNAWTGRGGAEHEQAKTNGRPKRRSSPRTANAILALLD